jgi:hypothetical protein
MSSKIITRVRQRAIDREARRRAHELDLQWREMMDRHRRMLWSMHGSLLPQLLMKVDSVTGRKSLYVNREVKAPSWLQRFLSLLGLFDAPRDGRGPG